MQKKNLGRLQELKIKRDFEYKQKKRLYYEKRKLKSQNKDPKEFNFNFEKTLSGNTFDEQMKQIAQMQKSYIDSKKKAIEKKIQQYKEQKSKYYKENKEARLQYDAQYREKNKESLKKYRKEYYQKKRCEQK
jgi:hypothetical protein